MLIIIGLKGRGVCVQKPIKSYSYVKSEYSLIGIAIKHEKHSKYAPYLSKIK